MRLLRTPTRVAGALLGLVLAAGAAHAQDPKPPADWSRRLTFSSPDGRFTLQLSNRVQARFDDIDFTPDPFLPPGQSGSADTSTFRIRRARTTFEGKAFGDVSYKFQFDWVANPSPTIIDAELRYTKYPLFQPWVGRGKAFFGRQQLTSSGRQQFIDRSILDGAFFPGRQNGVAILGELPSKVLEYQVGLYNGNGITNNVLNDDDEFLTTQRVVWHPFGLMPLEEGGTPYPDHFKMSIGVAALQNTTRSAIVTTTTPNTFDDADVDRVGVELAMGFKGISGVAEFITEEQEVHRHTVGTATVPSVTSARPAIDRDGFYAQVGYLFPNQKFELALRHAEITTETAALGSTARTEVDQLEDRIAFSWYMVKHDYKLQVDYGTLETENAITGRKTLESDEIRAQLQVNF
jgi:phosphate-selective porin OprO and OprP